ncbi:MAG: hypothetical protein A2X61_07310 [Ignavibacteria bacterium GWB2_35_12]|nr:MAG: hypothetical protein A2X63_08545 [Ignavibacteria bacterium GWA2_35_8]OGU39286.1 MAG: hypothetical protein A2X61_07310 [Ignavibacteria bacterium GWB2_35_12]OGU89482.1 MAG: hypothetical protein A2220_11055 [Ignavibacteria bacterium RIFOXYA2_FULL_35_10]OGV21168.1 MAG: hypothetical protein A2475_01410 [Ignavibacteria bacterium RIFOXYC2_FULL_35_21]
MRIRLFHIIFCIFIVLNLTGCYSTIRIKTSIFNFLNEKDEFVWIKLRTGEYYYFDVFRGSLSDSSVNVIGKAMLFPTETLFLKRDSLMQDTLSKYFFNSIIVNVNDIEEAEVIRYDPGKPYRAASFWGSLFPGCTKTPK